MSSDDRIIRMNFEDLSLLDTLVVEGYSDWVKGAPESWKMDGFLQRNSPIVVTSRLGQNAGIVNHRYEEEEANAWQLERDFSKLAFFTFALATSIE